VAKKATAAKKGTARRPAKLDPDDWLNGGDVEDAPAPEDDGEEIARGTAGMLVNKSKLGMIFGMSQAAVDKALANGAPYVSRGTRKEGWRINTAAFEAWRREELRESIQPTDPNKLTFDEAKAKKTQAEYERIEMENARRRGEYLTIDQALALYREEASVIRSHLMSVPGRVAIPAAAESDPGMIEALLQDEINIALTNITGDNAEAWTNDGRESDDAAEG
jgi:phage terminase Nu1 subunit (DNA packaging protein)